jgi:hypothetical protein
MNQTDISAHKFFNFDIPTYAYGCWPPTLTEKLSGMKVVTMELTCTCDIVDVWMSKVRPCRWVCWKCRRTATDTTHYHRLSLTEHAVTLNNTAYRPAQPCRQYRLLTVCIAPTAGGENTLTLCFTLASVLFVQILFGKISFPYYRCLSHYLFLCLYSVVSLCFIRQFEQSKFTATSRNAIIFLMDISNCKGKQTQHF